MLARTGALMEHVSRGSGISECIITGSIVRSTAIKRFSDVDVIAILDPLLAQQLTVEYSLDLIIKALSTTSYDAGVSGAAVSVSLAGDFCVDFLPAFDRRDQHGNRYFDIPRNDRKGWLRYRPEDLSRRVSSAAQTCGPDFKKLVRSAKWWARINRQPIASYELELIACDTFAAGLPELPRAVAEFFRNAASCLGSQVHVKAPGLKGASDAARQACELQDIGDMVRSTSLWRRLFGEQFPIIVDRDHLHS